MHALSLAGTAQSTHVYGCVVFDLKFVNEATNNSKIIDSCIDIIIDRPIIRAYHLVHKILRYFDEVSRFRPYLSHSDLPVLTVADEQKLYRIMIPSFAALGYDTTLRSSVAEDLPDEPRPLAASFADPQSSEGMRLILSLIHI